jgi:hypothetical protein
LKTIVVIAHKIKRQVLGVRVGGEYQAYGKNHCIKESHLSSPVLVEFGCHGQIVLGDLSTAETAETEIAKERFAETLNLPSLKCPSVRSDDNCLSGRTSTEKASKKSWL